MGLWGVLGGPWGQYKGVPLPRRRLPAPLPAVLRSVRSSAAPAGRGSMLREGPMQSGQRVRVKVKGMVSSEQLVGASAGSRRQLRLRGVEVRVKPRLTVRACEGPAGDTGHGYRLPPLSIPPQSRPRLASVATAYLLQTRSPRCAHKETCRDGGAVFGAWCACDSWPQKKKQDEPPGLGPWAGRRVGTAATGGFREVPSHSPVPGGGGAGRGPDLGTLLSCPGVQ